jgi:hypothetical protein
MWRRWKRGCKFREPPRVTDIDCDHIGVTELWFNSTMDMDTSESPSQSSLKRPATEIPPLPGQPKTHRSDFSQDPTQLRQTAYDAEFNRIHAGYFDLRPREEQALPYILSNLLLASSLPPKKIDTCDEVIKNNKDLKERLQRVFSERKHYEDVLGHR